jgi:hypothetical protein
MQTTRRDLLSLAALGMAAGAVRPVRAAPSGQLTVGVHITLAPTWLHPAETIGITKPYMMQAVIGRGGWYDPCNPSCRREEMADALRVA